MNESLKTLFSCVKKLEKYFNAWVNLIIKKNISIFA